MTRYEYLQNRKEECVKIARETKDMRLFMFFMNAAKGFIIRLNKLTIADLEEEV